MIDWIKSARCYLLMCYSGDVDVGFLGGELEKKKEEAWLDTKSDGGETKVGLTETKNPAKRRKVLWEFAECET